MKQTEAALPDANGTTVFITGALGLIGRRLAEVYREAGATVRGVDLRADPDLGVIGADITEPGDWQQAFSGVDVVVHTAAKVGMVGTAEDFWRINCQGTRNVLDAAAQHRVGRLVHLSSIVAFGFDYPDGVDERYPLRPNGVPYVDTKVASEQLVLQAHAAGEVSCTIVRPGDVYGPGSHFWAVTPLREVAARRSILPAMGRGHLAPVYVDDLVAGIQLAAHHEKAPGQVYIMTGGESVETRDYFNHFARMLGRSAVTTAPTWLVLAIAAIIGRLIPGSEVNSAAVRYIARRGGYSIRKAQQQLGYAPAVSLEAGMRQTEDWLRRSGHLPNA